MLNFFNFRWKIKTTSVWPRKSHIKTNKGSIVNNPMYSHGKLNLEYVILASKIFGLKLMIQCSFQYFYNKSMPEKHGSNTFANTYVFIKI